MEEEEEVDEVDERTARIEKWRLDQSRAVLEEIERETRRRQRRLSRLSGSNASMERATFAADSQSAVQPSHFDSVLTQGLATIKREGQGEQPPSESWWQRLTRRVIQDLIGLDETTLSVIFGEQLADDASPTPTQPSPIAARASHESAVAFHDTKHGWENKLLERIARELGILVHQLAEHDGAFATYVRTQQPPDYAGLPSVTPQLAPRRPALQTRRRSADQVTSDPIHSDALFQPTLTPSPASPLVNATDTSLWGIEEEPNDQAVYDDEAARLEQEQEYWEQDVDLRVIFSYLRRRFTSSTPSQPPARSTQPSDGPLPASWMTSTNQPTTASALGTSPESIRRAEVIRRQHPLVSRAAERAAAQTRRRDSLLRRHQMQTLMQKRPGSSSCASQSTKRSRRSKSGGSSRHYWDLGGSLGSVGSGPAMSSGLGGWGEV